VTETEDSTDGLTMCWPHWSACKEILCQCPLRTTNPMPIVVGSTWVVAMNAVV